jgi:hypothetical protein
MELHAANFKIAIDPTFKMWGSWSAYGFQLEALNV